MSDASNVISFTNSIGLIANAEIDKPTKTGLGVCRFCQQSSVVAADLGDYEPDLYPQELLDKHASAICQCEGAENERRRLDYLLRRERDENQAINRFNTLMTNESSDRDFTPLPLFAIDALRLVYHMMRTDIFADAAITLSDDSKVTMKLDKNGVVKVQRERKVTIGA